MPRPTCKEMADAWGIGPTKTSRVRDWTFWRFVTLMHRYPQQTLAELAYWNERVASEIDSDDVDQLTAAINGPPR